LYDYKEKLGNRSFLSPSLVIIGKVVALHQQFGWLQNSNSGEEYFAPVAGKLINYKDKAERA
jgi:uroporphyrin-III C-methyltransferase/precorrin-2 dehydrogenase/sirohydrochlorin ferrochelatase/uroporphyrin-III C-methyltransferase